MRQRQGFTLVEMLVAMALTMFVMVILSQAFIAALDTFRGLKAIGDMDEGLRTTVNALRSDLLMDHLVDDKDSPLQLKDVFGKTIKEGFFRIEQGAPVLAQQEERDWEDISAYPVAANPMISYRVSNHVLHFTVKAKGSRPENFFVASAGAKLLSNAIDFEYPSGAVTPHHPPNTVSSQWAEVAYHLEAQGSTNSPNQTGGTGTPLFKLYRSQFLVVSKNSDVNVATKALFADADQYKGISWRKNGADLDFSNPADLKTVANRRFPPTKDGRPPTDGRSLLLNNVVSFAVQVMHSGELDFGDVALALPAAYDTSSTPKSILALQISIRVWDAKTQSTRQITIIQDM